MNKLTGNKDTDFLILMQLNDKELKSVCQVNKYVKSLCDDDDFWRNRLIKNFKLERVEKNRNYFGFDTYKELYQFIKSYPRAVYALNFEKKVEDNIALIIKDPLPIWVNRELLIQDLRRKMYTLIITDFTKAHKTNVMNKDFSVINLNYAFININFS